MNDGKSLDAARAADPHITAQPMNAERNHSDTILASAEVMTRVGSAFGWAMISVSCVACGQESSDGGTTTDPTAVLPRPVPHEMGASDVVVCERDGGGFSGRAFGSTGLPSLVLYGDGRLFSGPQDAVSYEMNQARLSEAGVQAVLARADDLGLFAEEIVINELVSDAAGTTLRLLAGGRDVTHTIYPSGRSPLVNDYLGFVALDNFPAGSVLEPYSRWDYERVEVRITSSSAACEASPWPLADLGDVPSGVCLDLTAEEALPLATPAGEMDSGQLWSVPMGCYQTRYRPILPHETACAESPPSACNF